MLCSYGCGREAVHQFKNGKWCCEKSRNSCPNEKQKNSIAIKKQKRKPKILKDNNKVLCDYGCGRLAKYYFEASKKFCCCSHYKKCIIHREKFRENTTGSKNPMYNKQHTEESRKKISHKMSGENNPMYNKYHTEDSKEKMRKNHSINSGRKKRITNIDLFGEERSKEISQNISKSNQGRTLTDYQKEKIKIRVQGKGNPMFGKQHKEISKKIMRKKAKARFKNDEFLRKWVNSVTNKGPNKPEIFLNDLLYSLFDDEYEFVGDYSLWIGGKNPDFLNKKKRKLIEYFGNWWHSEKRTENLEDKYRRNHFEKFGYDVFIIREHHLKDTEKLKIKLMEFNNA